MSPGARSSVCMANDVDKKAEVDAAFLNASNEAKRLEKEAIPTGAKAFPSGAIFEQFDVEKISIDSYEAALKDAQGIEREGIKTPKRPEERAGRAVGQKVTSEEEPEHIPREKVEVLARSEQEILEEERKLESMKEKFAKLMSEAPQEKPIPEAPKEDKAPKAPVEKPAMPEPERPEAVVETARAEEKQLDATKVEEIKELSENFKRITMKKEEREKQERIRKMKKEIEDMLESG